MKKLSSIIAATVTAANFLVTPAAADDSKDVRLVPKKDGTVCGNFPTMRESKGTLAPGGTTRLCFNEKGELAQKVDPKIIFNPNITCYTDTASGKLAMTCPAVPGLKKEEKAAAPGVNI